MSFLTTDYSNVQENTGFEPLPTGNYEMIIADASEDATPSGAETLQITLVVRNDLDGVAGMEETNKKFKNRRIFNDNWKRKATHQYDMDGFQSILKAVGVPEGTSVNSVDQFIDLLIGKPVKVYVKQEENTYNGETKMVNRVAPWNYSETDFPSVQHTGKEERKETPVNQPDVFISDADLPF